MGEKDYIEKPVDVLIDGYGFRKLTTAYIDNSCLNLPAGAVLVEITKSQGNDLQVQYFIQE